MFGLDDLFFVFAGPAYVAAKWIHEGVNATREQDYIARQGYNRERQLELERMVYNADPKTRKAFDRLVGRTINRKSEWDARVAVREIALREGWKYYDIDELFSDPYYVKIIGGKWPEWKTPGVHAGKTWEAKARAILAETERRKSWFERCPHGNEVDLFPMDFDSEEEYRKAIASKYYEWRHSYKDCDFLKVYPIDFDTEAEYKAAVEKKRRHYEQYSAYRDERTDFGKMMVQYHVDVLEEQWEKRIEPTKTPLEVANAVYDWVCDYNYCLDEYTSILKDKCAIEGVDWDELMAYRSERR